MGERLPVGARRRLVQRLRLIHDLRFRRTPEDCADQRHGALWYSNRIGVRPSPKAVWGQCPSRRRSTPRSPDGYNKAVSGQCTRCPLSVKWADAVEHTGVRKADSGSPSTSGCVIRELDLVASTGWIVSGCAVIREQSAREHFSETTRASRPRAAGELAPNRSRAHEARSASGSGADTV